MAGKIFVCYRRDDSAGHAGRIYDRLNQRFPGHVFMDVAGISIGTRWAEVIEDTMRSCRVAVILIGKRWLEAGADGERRIDRRDDPIRAEIQTALRLNLKIVPLLVGGAGVPERSHLPTDLATIADWQALRVDDDDFDHDATRLVRALERELGDAPEDPHLERDEAKNAEVRRLVSEAEGAIERADWISAKQMLQAVLALDRHHAAAAERLRFVTEQSKHAYQTETKSRSRVGRWVAIGAVGAFVALMLVGWIASVVENGPGPDDEDSHVVDTVKREPTVPPVTPANAQPQPVPQAVPPPAPQQPSLAGDYALASYTEGGIMIPATGAMRLTPMGSNAFQFNTMVMAAGVRVDYIGVLQPIGSGLWTTTTSQTNDPRAVYTPIRTQMQFDGSTLATQNEYGQAAVWRKR